MMHGVILTAVIMAAYGLMAAKEFWRSDGLRSRYPIAIAMVVHSAMLLVRIPLAMSEMHHHPVVAFASLSFDLMAIEAMIFAQSIAFLFISLTKERVEAQLRHAALTDSLTGLSNRRALFEDGRSLMAQSVRNRQPVSLAVLDLDGFKQINDAFGHPIGDVIRDLADAARASLCVRPILIGRIGGERIRRDPAADGRRARLFHHPAPDGDVRGSRSRGRRMHCRGLHQAGAS